MILLWTVLLVGLGMLILGAKLLVDGSGTLAERLRVPPIAIGLTVVAFGTSAPELVVSLIASFSGSSAVVLGNVVGSNIFNVLLILGIAALVRPLAVHTKTTWIEIPLSLLAALVLIVIAHDTLIDRASGNVIARSEGLLLLGFFAVFMVYSVTLIRSGTSEPELAGKAWSPALCVVAALCGMVLLLAGGRAVVNAAIELARGFGISERLIGVTIVAAGTSLPELVTSLVAAAGKRVDLAVGNVVGSNIFNIFGVLGLAAVARPVAVPVGSSLDIAVNAGAAMLLFLFAFFGPGKRIGRAEGVGFLLLYVGYLLFTLLAVDGTIR